MTNATVVEGPITTTTTWSGVIHVRSSVSVRNEAVLTIEPGTKIIVGLNANVEFGWQGSHPTVMALGTTASPIRFCGEAARPGYWGRIDILENVAPESTLRNVLVADGGGAAGGALMLWAPISIQGVQVRDSARDGVIAAAFGSDSRLLIVKGAEGAPVQAFGSGGVNIPVDSDLTGNGEDIVRMRFTELDRSPTFRAIGVPYRQEFSVGGVAAGAGPVTVSFGPGVEYEFSGRSVLDVGDASLQAVGTATAPVVFRAAPCTEPLLCSPISARRHAGRLVVGRASPNVRLEHVDFRQGGWSTQATTTPFRWTRHGAIEIASTEEATLKNVSLTEAEGWGIGFSGSAGGFAVDSSGLSVSVEPVFGGGPFAASILLGSDNCRELFSLPLDTVLGANPRLELGCRALGVAGTVRAFATPYAVPGSISIGQPVVFEPGTQWSMESNSGIDIFEPGSVSAVGTAAAPITFTTPFGSPGTWQGFEIGGPNVVFEHVVVSHGGRTFGTRQGANIRALVPVTLRNSTVSESSEWGLLRGATDNSDYAATNSFTGNVIGDIGQLN